jgi:hypothetical protein
MQKYDVSVIDSFADDLYNRAGTVVVVSTLMYAAIGAAAGYFLFKGLGAVLGGLLGGGLGFHLGQQKAFLLKLQAQTALCQAQIERNTRADSIGGSMAAMPVSAALVEAVAPSTGTCTSCKASIPLTSKTCPNCMAALGQGSVWQVVPSA